MSEQRSSSAVRNLRSMFENKTTLDSSSPKPRGRSPNGPSSDKESGSRRTSKVRASFVSVEPSKNISESMAQRRGSFTETDGDVLELRKTISEQQDTLEVPEKALLDSAVASTVGSAATTPSRKPSEGRSDAMDGSPLAGKHEKEPEDPDKPITGAEEEPAEMKPADPADADAVSGGDALPPVAEDLRADAKPTSSGVDTKKKEAKKPMINGKPDGISTKTGSKPGPSSLKSPASQPSSSDKASPGISTSAAPAKKASRSSLTAPTAASMARNGPASDRSSNPKMSPDSKPKAKPREVTKPINVPSHLTAPTASSRAKHEPETAGPTSSSSLKTSTISKPKPQAAPTKATSRSSLAAQQRRESHSSQTSARKSMPVDGSFLDRMMKQTAASANHAREKVEAKSPVRSKAAAPKPKANGTAQKATSKPISKPATAHGHVDGHQDSPVEASVPKTAADADQTTAGAESTGNETPNARINGEAETALEATPATLGGEDMIR